MVTRSFSRSSLPRRSSGSSFGNRRPARQGGGRGFQGQRIDPARFIQKAVLLFLGEKILLHACFRQFKVELKV